MIRAAAPFKVIPLMIPSDFQIPLMVPVSFHMNVLTHKGFIVGRVGLLPTLESVRPIGGSGQGECLLVDFVRHLTMVHSFICRGDAHDGFRGLIRGIEFTPNSFIVNISNLERLMFCSRSCVSRYFQRLGSELYFPASDLPDLLTQMIPRIAPTCLCRVSDPPGAPPRRSPSCSYPTRQSKSR
jgi:hypothetical protein